MDILRQQSEIIFEQEIEELKKQESGKKPQNWQMTPQSVLTYLMGGKLANGFEISPKYIGDKRIIEIAIATLVTDRALLLYGVPGTGKSMVSEHLAAAISGDSTLIVQGTAGTSEEAIRYGWNYAELLAKGPSKEALVDTPVMKAMQSGQMVRVEELTRIPAEVQDTLITILSEKSMPIAELNTQVSAIKGFNLIATANNKDKGVNELSGALKRRFNTVILPLPVNHAKELEIVESRVHSLADVLDLPIKKDSFAHIHHLVTIFRELRDGVTEDGTTKLKVPTGTLSTAEVISVVNQGLSLSAYFGDGELNADDMAAGLIGAVVKDPLQDEIAFKEYLDGVLRKRKEYRDIYLACKELI
jgi:MoxR-like ATPase